MSNVSRSVYQKVCEENKRLKEDIKILVCTCISNYDRQKHADTVNKWRKRFRDDEELRQILKDFATEYIKEHPELKIPKP